MTSHDHVFDLGGTSGDATVHILELPLPVADNYPSWPSRREPARPGMALTASKVLVLLNAQMHMDLSHRPVSVCRSLGST